MLFNSFIFIFLFLPIALSGFYLTGAGRHHHLAIGWLILTSLFFYGWWNPNYLILIVGSIVFNYGWGRILGQKRHKKKYLLAVGILTNIILLGFFKYANFFVANMSDLFGLGLSIRQIALPLAISFFTFQQIGYLVDAWRDDVAEYRFGQYCLFVTFFPQLIAGPIVRQKEMIPQFAGRSMYRQSYENIAVGLVFFSMGLFKKVVIADTMGPYAGAFFDAAGRGAALSLGDCWIGMLTYSFQIYFDFSGYTDMAIGLARMFGIRLTINFNSPYKATSVIAFWRRWHISLSRFLRNYLYAPLGGNRNGALFQYRNILITMLICGLWHGAGWPFVAWGAVHGIYLIVNHAWRVWGGPVFRGLELPRGVSRNVSWATTFICIVTAWAFFRADSIHTAFQILKTMAGCRGFSFSPGESLFPAQLPAYLVALVIAVRLMPNTLEIMARYHPVIERGGAGQIRFTALNWRPSLAWAIVHTITILSSLYIMITSGYHEFIYRFF